VQVLLFIQGVRLENPHQPQPKADVDGGTLRYNQSN